MFHANKGKSEQNLGTFDMNSAEFCFGRRSSDFVLNWNRKIIAENINLTWEKQ